jgi:hypothetical protein
LSKLEFGQELPSAKIKKGGWLGAAALALRSINEETSSHVYRRGGRVEIILTKQYYNYIKIGCGIVSHAKKQRSGNPLLYLYQEGEKKRGQASKVARAVRATIIHPSNASARRHSLQQ